MASNIPVIVQGNSFSLAIPLQIYYINGDQMDLQDYTPDPTDEISIQLKGERRQYTYTPTVDGNTCNIDLSGNELAGNYSVVVSIVKASGQRLRSFRTDQFFIVESSDDLTPADIIEGLEENVIYLNSSIFVAGEDGRGITSIIKTATAGLVDTYTITYSDNTTSTFNVTNGAQGEAGATIASIEKTATSGKVDTYTITMTDGNTFDFQVTNGLDGVDLGLANIVNDLTTGGATNVLSAEMGKEIGMDVLLNNKETNVELEKGTILSADGTKSNGTGYDSAQYRQRARMVHLMRVNGDFSISLTAGYQFKLFYYSDDDYTTFVNTDDWASAPYTGHYVGWITMCIKNNASSNFEPTDIVAKITTRPLRIYDKLDSQRLDLALSANVGKTIGDALWGGSETLILDQGGFNPTTKMPDLPSDATHNCRIRTRGLIPVSGEFTISVNAGYSYTVYFYTSNDYADYHGQTAWNTNTQTFEHYGYISVLYKNTANGATKITPMDIVSALTALPIVRKTSYLPDPPTFDKTYQGEIIKVGQNKYKHIVFKQLPQALSQAMAVYGNYILLFTYATSTATAYLIELSTTKLLATLTLPNSTYKRPHCNAVSFGVTFNSSNSILPLLYVSQWDNDSQKGCLVYDITLNGGTYSANLVQAILPTNVATTTRGAGQTDWVVDPLGYLYSIGYLLDDGAHTLPNNKTMIAKYKLPAISDGAEVVLGDADVLEHFDVPIYIYRQDAIFENGRILMLAGMTGAVDRRLLAIDPVAKQITSIVSLDYINKEPEGIGVSDGNLLIGFNGDAVIYRFDFI